MASRRRATVGVVTVPAFAVAVAATVAATVAVAVWGVTVT